MTYFTVCVVGRARAVGGGGGGEDVDSVSVLI